MVRLLCFAVFFFVLACDDGIADFQICNDNLAVVRVFVMDANGTAVENLSFRTVLTRTNKIVGFPGATIPFGGWYPVVSDIDREVLRSGGDSLAFAAWDSTHVATARFVVGSDPCHIFRKEGPDTIVAF